MSTTNAPGSNIEGLVGGPNGERQNMLELFDDVAEEKVFSFLHNEASLLEALRNNPTKTYREIREEMRRKLMYNPKGYENFTEEDVFNTAKLSDKAIQEKLEILLVHVKSCQDRLKKRAESLFASETFADTPNGNENRRMLNEWIPKQNAKDIEKYLKSPAFLRRKLGRECFGDERIATFVSRESIIGLADLGIAVNDLSNEEKAAVNAIFSGAINSERGHIQTYLKIIERSPKDAATKLQLKKDLLHTTLPTVSPKFLVENEVITKAVGKERVRLGLQSVLGEDYFTTGTPEEKAEKQRYLDHVYEKSEHIELPIDDYLDNDAFVESVFGKGKLGVTDFTRTLEDTLTDMRAENAVAEFDLDGMDIQPDVVSGKWHESFIDNISKLKDGEAPKVRNAQNLQKGSYIHIVQERNGEKVHAYIEVLDTDIELNMPVEGKRDQKGHPIKHRGLRFNDWAGDGQDGMVTPGHERGGLEYAYAKLWALLKDPSTHSEVLSETDIARRRKTAAELEASGEQLEEGEDHIKTIYKEDDEFASLDTLSESLGWKPEKGAIYTSQEAEGGNDWFLEVLNIQDDGNAKKITISDGKETHTVSFSDFYHKLAIPLKLKAQGKYSTADDINSLLQGIEGYKDIVLKDGVLKQVIKGEDGETLELPVTHFMNDDGEGIYFDSLSSGGAEVGFGAVKKSKKKGEDWLAIKGKVNLKAFDKKKQHSLVGILNILRENDYKPHVNPKDKPEVDHEGHMPHSHGSLWGKIMNGTSVSDMMKAFDLYKHAWEHKLEKNSKFQSAKFADKYLRKLMPEGFSYQLRSEAYAAQNEAMEGILKMLENDMSGKEARLYIRKKILLNDDAKFEEVLAGLLYISKKSGQLYPEELSDLKNSQLWFYKLAVTQGHTSKASRQALREKCIKSTDKGADGLDAITEIDLVERQLKFYEGKGYRIPPNIAPKFPGAIKEGEEESKKKGEMEVNQRSNIKQMNKYALSKGYVGEWYKVLGTVDRLHTKNGSPAELNAMPFLMVYSNAPEYMGSNFRKALHSEGTGARASHAFKFGNEMPLVKTYRSVVQIAAEEVSRRTGKTEILDKLKKIEKDRKKIGEESHDDEPDQFQKDWIISINDFWMEYGDKLQPILQMSDPYITAEATFSSDAETRRLCKAYKDRFTGTSVMQNGQLISGGEIYKNANVGEGNMIPDHTPFAFTNMVNASFSAIYSQNGMMGTSSHNKSAEGKIWKPGVLGAFGKLKGLTERDIPKGMNLEDVQYNQFREMFAAIMYYIRKNATNPPEMMIGGGSTGRGGEYKKMDYIRDLEKYGFRLKSSDFRYSQTIPPGAEEVPTGGPNDLEIDSIDEGRCREFFKNFLRGSGDVVNRVRGGIDWDGIGG